MHLYKLQNVIVIGAGLVGLTTAIYLRKRGYQVEIFERLPDIRLISSKYDFGRNLSIDITNRGLMTLDQLGIKQDILNQSIPMESRVLHLYNSEKLILSYGKTKEQVINTVSRKSIHLALLKLIDDLRIPIYFEHELMNIDVDLKIFTIFNRLNKVYTQKNYNLMLGCDGVNSVVRKYIELYSGIHCKKKVHEKFYLELELNDKFNDLLEPKSMHMWPREHAMILAQPNQDKKFMYALLMNEYGANSFASLKDINVLKNFLKNNFFHLVDHTISIHSQIISKPQGRFTTNIAEKWMVKGILLLGDSAHSIVPFAGQGINCSFEDCRILNQFLDEFADNWDEATFHFESERKKNAEAIAKISLNCYPEFNDLSLNKAILLRQVEDLLSKNFPEYISYHNMYHFENVPYFMVEKVQEEQIKLITSLIKDIDFVHQLDWNKIKYKISHYISSN